MSPAEQGATIGEAQARVVQPRVVPASSWAGRRLSTRRAMPQTLARVSPARALTGGGEGDPE